MAKPGRKPNARLLSFDSMAAAAEHIGGECSIDLLKAAKKAGCGAFRNGRIYVHELQEWLKTNKPDASKLASKEGMQIRKLQLECERLEFKNEVERGLYTENTKIHEDLFAIGAAIGAALDKLQVDLPALLLGKDENGMAGIIKRETKEIRAMLADKTSRLYGPTKTI